jgi:hypothetical protein
MLKIEGNSVMLNLSPSSGGLKLCSTPQTANLMPAGDLPLSDPSFTNDVPSIVIRSTTAPFQSSITQQEPVQFEAAKMLQKQQDEIDQLKRRVAALEAKLEEGGDY